MAHANKRKLEEDKSYQAIINVKGVEQIKNLSAE